jgi:hypothetical protein
LDAHARHQAGGSAPEIMTYEINICGFLDPLQCFLGVAYMGIAFWTRKEVFVYDSLVLFPTLLFGFGMTFKIFKGDLFEGFGISISFLFGGRILPEFRISESLRRLATKSGEKCGLIFPIAAPLTDLSLESCSIWMLRRSNYIAADQTWKRHRPGGFLTFWKPAKYRRSRGKQIISSPEL